MKTTYSLAGFFLFSQGIIPGSAAFNTRPFANNLSTAWKRQSPCKNQLMMASPGKGFGNTNPPPSPKKTSPQAETTSSVAPQQVPIQMNEGQKALERMRREKAEQKDLELRQVKAIRETDKLLQETPDAAAIPEKVAMRMGKRMLPFVGIPLFGTLGAFVLFWYLATYKDMQFESGLVALSTVGILVIGLLGITYSVMSASWDEEREGSALGIDEFKKNVDNIKDGLDRSKENLALREKMAGLGDAEIEAAIDDLNARDAAKEKKLQSLASKLNDELE